MRSLLKGKKRFFIGMAAGILLYFIGSTVLAMLTS